MGSLSFGMPIWLTNKGKGVRGRGGHIDGGSGD